MKSRSITLMFSLLLLAIASTASAAQETGNIKGKVRSGDGEKLADVTVTARRDGKNVKSMKTDEDGDFKMSGLAPGIYNIVFEKPGYGGSVLYDVEVRRKKTNNLGDRLRLQVDRGTLVILEASVFNQNGFVLRGAKVTVEEVREDGSTKEVAEGYSSEDGDVIFRFPESPKTYRITAKIGKRSASKDLEVDYAAIYRTSITIDLSEEN